MNVAILWLFNAAGEVLMSRRTDKVDDNPGLWGPSVSGAIEEGESAQQGGIREAKEELGIEIEGPVYPTLQEDYVSSAGVTLRFSVFATTLSEKAISGIHLEEAEVADVRWITIPGLEAWLLERPEEIIISEAHGLWGHLMEGLRNGNH